MKRKFLFALSLASLMCLGGCTFLTSCGGESTSETEVETYSVTCASEGVTLVGLSSDGYKTGDTVTFTISVSDTTKEVDVVKMGSTVLGNVNGVYSFTMGTSDVAIEVSLKDKVVETYTVSYESSGEFAITGLAEKYVAGDTVTFGVSVTNLDKEVDTVTSEEATITAGEDGTYSFTMPAKNVKLTVTLKDLDGSISGDGGEDDPYLITNRAQLLSLSSKIASGELEASGVYTLGADIDLTGAAWTPIGTMEKPFTGVFEGNGYSIKGLEFSSFTPDYVLEGETYKFGGLFGVAFDARISDLSLTDYKFDTLVYGADSYVYFGGLVGLANNTIIRNVDVSYAKFAFKSLQNGYSGAHIGGLVGGYWVNSSDPDYSVYMDFKYNTVKGDLVVDTKDSEGLISYVGGVIGDTDGSYGSGIIAISETSFEGNITGGTYVGGIAGYIDMYGSISDSYAIGDSLISEDSDGSYVGGIVGGTYYETILLNTYAGYSTLTAPNAEGYYLSYAGELVGYGYENGYAEGSKYLGTGVANSFFKSGAKVSADNVVIKGEAVSSTTDLFTTKLNFNDAVWDLTKEYPTLKAGEKNVGDVTVTIDSQGNGANKSVVMDGGTYDAEGLTTINETTFAKEHNSFNGFTYDKEGKEFFRWYVPFGNDTTLYAKFTDLTPLLGDYAYQCDYYGNTVSTGHFKFTDDTFYWLSDDYQVFKYNYHLLDNYIFVDDALPSATGEAYGGYANTIFFLNEDGTITGYDLTDQDAVYTATRTDDAVVLPDYTGNKLLGSWYGYEDHFTLYSDGTSLGNSNDSKYEANGGFNIEGNTIDLTIMGMYGEYVYDETHDVLLKDGDLYAREKVSAKYIADDLSVTVFVAGTHTYVVKDGAVSDLTVEGELVEGGKVTIGGIEYTVSGDTLVAPEEPEPEPDEPGTTLPGYVGTWTGTFGYNSGELVLNEDGTGTYMGNAITYTVEGTTITFSAADFTFTLTYDESTQTLKGTMVDDYGEYVLDVSCTGFKAPESGEETPVPASFYGTWSGTLTGMNTMDVTFVLNSDGTGTYGDFNFTYEVDGDKLTASFDEYEVTAVFDSENMSLSVTVVYAYEYTYTGVLTEFTPGETEETPVAASFYGTWSGTLNGTMEVTFVLNSDGTGSYGDFDFTYEVNGNTLTASFDLYEVTAVFDPENMSLSLTVVYDYMSEFKGVLTDFTPESTQEETPTVSTYVGTWSGSVGMNNVTLTLNADGTGSYNGTDITYTVEGTTISFYCADMTFTLTYDSASQTLKGNAVDDYGEYNLEVTLTTYTPAE